MSQSKESIKEFVSFTDLVNYMNKTDTQPKDAVFSPIEIKRPNSKTTTHAKVAE